MKKLTTFLLTVFLFFIAGFILARTQTQISHFFQNNPAETCFKPTPYPLQNRRFVIAISGRNNGATVDKTLRSVLFQNYETYRVIYIDDASTDGSFLQARDVIYESGHASKVLLVQNEHPEGTISNLLRAAENCLDDEILVVVGGEDLLAHEWVLQKLNQYYANPDLWMTYSKYLELPTFIPGENLSDKDAQNPRNISLPPLHLKTFYAALFKNVQEDDLIYQGAFMPDSADLAYMIPLLEMAKGHIQYLDEVLYLVAKHPKKDEKLHEALEVAMRDKTSYAPLNQLFEIKEQ